MFKITKAGIDSAATVAAGVASAVLPILVAANDVSANTAAAIGAGLAAVLVGYHSGAAVTSATGATTSALASTGTLTDRPVVDADADPQLAAQ